VRADARTTPGWVSHQGTPGRRRALDQREGPGAPPSSSPPVSASSTTTPLLTSNNIGVGFELALERMQTIPGVGRRTAEVLVAEIGTDLTRFPSARHLASWAGLCPGHDERAGKRRSGRTRKSSPWLRTALVEAARAAARSKETYLAAQYRRLAARRGAKRAAVAVAHSILVMVYALLTQQIEYHDLGGHYFDKRDRQAVERRLVRRLEALGYSVSLEPTSPAA
jgi:transposase